jgi:hypothetical protein
MIWLQRFTDSIIIPSVCSNGNILFNFGEHSYLAGSLPLHQVRYRSKRPFVLVVASGDASHLQNMMM